MISDVALLVDPELGDHPGAAGLGATRALTQLRQQFAVLPRGARLLSSAAGNGAVIGNPSTVRDTRRRLCLDVVERAEPTIDIHLTVVSWRLTLARIAHQGDIHGVEFVVICRW